jgi:Mycobacterium membrane protein
LPFAAQLDRKRGQSAHQGAVAVLDNDIVGQRDSLEAVEQPVDCDLALQSRQRRSDAVMNAVPEQRLTNQPVPWSFSFTNKDASPTSMLVVTANPTGQKTTCTVSVNGTVKDTQSKTGAGEDNMVQCSTMGNP